MKLLPTGVLLMWLALLTACASGPQFDTGGVDPELTASKVAGAPVTGARVVWGGVIVATRNLPDYTEMEVLSYPLEDNQKPDTEAGEQGRFLARQAGYLEVVDYAPGRRVTISGRVTDTLPGKVGEAAYTFPLLQADEIYLWSRDGRSTSPRFQFGVGVMFSR